VARHPHRPTRGFTLVEAVMVIAITGVVAAMVASFVRKPVDAYVDLARRAELTDTGSFIEFLPVRSAGRYRAVQTAAGGGDILDFGSGSDASFDVLGPPVAALAGDQLVVHNLGLSGADAYEGTSRRALTSTGAALSSLAYTLGGSQFPFASPNQRFHIVATPVSFVCAPVAGGAGTLRRYGGYTIQATQPSSTGAAPLSGLSGDHNALLAGSVSGCSFTYGSSSTARNAVVTLRLTLTGGGESITLLQQVQVENSP
jgi:MSHA biogenesis protein MshO